MFIAKDITVHICRREILSRVDFTARAGEFTAIVGPNGSGKSTLITALTGERAYDGRVEMEGLDPATARPWELASRRGVLSQFTQVAFPFTVAEVVRLGVEAGGHATKGDPVAHVLARVGLTGYGARSYHTLSGGEQQRVQLARVLVQIGAPTGAEGPRWLLLDEPVSSLDIAHQLEVMEIARDFARAGGGVIAVMHDLNLTAMYADQVALMAHGRVVRQGRVDEVFQNDILSRAYGCRVAVNTAPPGATYILPQAAEA